jgi:hypothetical protein
VAIAKCLLGKGRSDATRTISRTTAVTAIRAMPVDDRKN